MRKIITIIGVLAIFIAIYKIIFTPFNEDIKGTYSRLNNTKTDTLETYVGQIEYKVQGEGTPVLISHGMFGGYDQSLLFGKYLFGDNFKKIAISRYGYLGADVPMNPSPRTQSAAYKELLDTLSIDRAIIAGISTGGPMAIKFAQVFPERTMNLILLNSPITGRSRSKGKIAPPNMLLNDFMYWSAMEYKRTELLENVSDIDKNYYKNMSFKERKKADRIIRSMAPINPRRKGVITDKEIMNRIFTKNYGDIKLDMVFVPTLIFYTRDNPLVSRKKIQKLNRKISNSKLVRFQKGGRFILGHLKNMKKRIRYYLNGNKS